MATRKLKHNCKENDNHFYMVFEDDKLDELHFGNALEREWVIIGKQDLIDGLRFAGYGANAKNVKKGAS